MLCFKMHLRHVGFSEGAFLRCFVWNTSFFFFFFKVVDALSLYVLEFFFFFLVPWICVCDTDIYTGHVFLCFSFPSCLV